LIESEFIVVEWKVG